MSEPYWLRPNHSCADASLVYLPRAAETFYVSGDVVVEWSLDSHDRGRHRRAGAVGDVGEAERVDAGLPC